MCAFPGTPYPVKSKVPPSVHPCAYLIIEGLWWKSARDRALVEVYKVHQPVHPCESNLLPGDTSGGQQGTS